MSAPLDVAAERIAELAVECAEGVMDPSVEVSWDEAARVIERCSRAVSEQRFGPYGGCYDYQTKAGSRPLGFVENGQS